MLSIEDTVALSEIIVKVMDEHPAEVDAYRKVRFEIKYLCRELLSVLRMSDDIF